MTKGRRFVFQIALLPVLYFLSLPSPTVFSTIVAVALFIPPAICGSVAGVLIWSSRQAPGLLTLRERADDAVTSFLQSLGAASVGAIVLLMNFGITIPGKPVLALLTWICVLIAVPAIGWMGTWQSVWLPLIRRRSPADGDADGPSAQWRELPKGVGVEVDRVTSSARAPIREGDSYAGPGANGDNLPPPVRPKRRP